MDEMVEDHEKDVELFEQQAESGEDPDLRTFAEGALPTLREHLELAKQVQSQITAAGGDGVEPPRQIGQSRPCGVTLRATTRAPQSTGRDGRSGLAGSYHRVLRAVTVAQRLPDLTAGIAQAGRPLAS